MLTANSDELLDLAQGSPELAPGLRLVKVLGSGGMSTVFLAEHDLANRSSHLSARAPTRLAVKITQPAAMVALETHNIDHREIIKKDSVALSRVMERDPPTEYVIGFYGGGESEVIVRQRAIVLPWLAIEYVDGGSAGTSLQDRVLAMREGIDPPRAFKLARGIIEGVKALHDVGAIHRDLKPDNVLIAGPIDDETPKIADCGIARIAGVQGATFNACTIDYAGIEQLRALPGELNPLIGPWTDVHALTAVVWFILAGEPWCRGANDTRYLLGGERRSLRTAQRLHQGFSLDDAFLDRLDAVMRRGGAARLPERGEEAAAQNKGTMTADLYTAIAGTLPKDRRYASVDELAASLLPMLADAEARWKARAAADNRPATAFRPTMMAPASTELAAQAIERPKSGQLGDTKIQKGNVVFQTDGKILARMGARLVYFVEGQPRKVAVPAEIEPAVARGRWLTRGPGGGFAIVGASDLVLVRAGRLWAAALPPAAGQVQAAFCDGRSLAIVTEGTDDSDGAPELWQTEDGTLWKGPTDLSIQGQINAIAGGPFGLVAVGGAPNRKSARVVSVGFDGVVTVMPRLKDFPPFDLVVCGAGREAWAAAAQTLVRLERDAALPEPATTPIEGAPISLALDLVGQPWLVTDHAVYRRHASGGEPQWALYYRRDSTRPTLVGVGFTPRGAHVIDTEAAMVDIAPTDIGSWQESR